VELFNHQWLIPLSKRIKTKISNDFRQINTGPKYNPRSMF